MNSSKTPAPREINEKEATGDIKALYEDIREVLGTGIIPLVYRLIAGFPGGLSWCWHTVRPLYISGVVPRSTISLQAHLQRRFAGLSLPAPVCVTNKPKIRLDQEASIQSE